jgi:probable O-glycosylation ligase (exosortase A-associated)
MKGLIFVYALTFGGALIALFRPFYGVLVYACFACLRPDYLWSWSLPTGNYSRTVAIATLIGWSAAGFGNWKFMGGAKTILKVLLAYWSWIIVSAIFAANQSVAWDYVILHTKILLPVVVGLTLIRDVSQLKQVAWVIVACLGFLALEGNRDYLAGGQQVRLYGFGGMDNNSFCIAMVAGAGVAFFLGLSESNWWKKLAALSAAALMTHVPMFADSRGGMLGLIVAGVATFIMLPKRPAFIAAFALATIIALRFAGPAVIERFSTTFASEEARDSSAQSRLDLWANCWDVMQKNPISGIGPNHWPLIAETYGWPKGKEAHSLWFNAGAELGFPGLFLLFGFYALTIKHCWRLARSNTGIDPWLKDAGRMAVVGLSAFVVSASFVSLDALEVPYYILLLGAGAVSVASRMSLAYSDETESVYFPQQQILAAHT